MPDYEKGAAIAQRYRKEVWRPFMSAIKEYRLVSQGDAIAVCVSGGKDSMLLALCMRELQRRSPLDFALRYLCMDPGYTPETRAQIEENARALGLPLEFFSTDIFAALEEMQCNPCFMCAKMRRGYLYRRAQALGCNKIALGHHFDDAVETLLMSIIYAGQLRGMRPRLKSSSVPGMELIRPLYKVKEQQITAWRDENALCFPGCACAATRREAHSQSRRQQMKTLVDALNSLHPDAAANIFRSGHNAMLDSLNGWKQVGIVYSLLDEFDN